MWPAPTQTFTHVTPGGKVSTPTGDNAFLHTLELNVRTELALAETSQPQEEAGGGPIEEWLSDPADAPRYEASLRSLLGAVEALEDASGPRDHPPPTEVPASRPHKQRRFPDGHHDAAAGAGPRQP
jgi:hypothetical protein